MCRPDLARQSSLTPRRRYGFRARRPRLAGSSPNSAKLPGREFVCRNLARRLADIEEPERQYRHATQARPARRPAMPSIVHPPALRRSATRSELDRTSDTVRSRSAQWRRDPWARTPALLRSSGHCPVAKSAPRSSDQNSGAASGVLHRSRITPGGRLVNAVSTTSATPQKTRGERQQYFKRDESVAHLGGW